MKVSVILPAYNAEETIAEAIQSIIEQSYTDWELLVINDGSKDRTKDVVLSFRDSRIRYIENDVNKKLVYTLNRGLSLATGEYIARMDADDISMSERFARQIEYLEKNELDLVGCMTKRIDMDGSCVIPLANKSYSPETITRCIKYDNCIAHPTWLGKKTMFDSLNGYRYLHACEDYDFLLRAVRLGYKMGICDSIQLYYRENFNGISLSNLFKQRLSAKYLRNNYMRIDSISQQTLDHYLEKRITNKDERNYIKGIGMFDQGIDYLRKGKTIGFFFVLRSIFNSKYLLGRLYILLRIQIVRKIYK